MVTAHYHDKNLIVTIAKGVETGVLGEAMSFHRILKIRTKIGTLTLISPFSVACMYPKIEKSHLTPVRKGTDAHYPLAGS